MNIILLCSSPWSVHTQTYALSAGCLLLCSWSISLRAVFGAWGQWEQTGGREAGGCICQGTSFRGPTVAWLSFHVCLQKHSLVEGEREIEGKTAALPLFSRVPSVGSLGWWSVSTSSCFSLSCFSPSRLLEMQNVHSTINRYVPIHCYFFGKLRRPVYFVSSRIILINRILTRRHIGQRNTQCAACFHSLDRIFNALKKAQQTRSCQQKKVIFYRFFQPDIVFILLTLHRIICFLSWQWRASSCRMLFILKWRFQSLCCSCDCSQI